MSFIKPCHATGLLYHLKTSDNFWFTSVFRRHKKDQRHEMRLNLGNKFSDVSKTLKVYDLI